MTSKNHNQALWITFTNDDYDDDNNDDYGGGGGGGGGGDDDDDATRVLLMHQYTWSWVWNVITWECMGHSDFYNTT